MHASANFRVLLVLAGVAAAGSPLAAQDSAAARSLRAVVAVTTRGSPVRVERFDGRRATGALGGVEDAAFLLEAPGSAPVRIPYGEVLRFWVRGRSVSRGALLGGGAGLTAGVILGAIVGGWCEDECGPGSGPGALVGGLLLGSAGAGLGAIVGAAIPRWKLKWEGSARPAAAAVPLPVAEAPTPAMPAPPAAPAAAPPAAPAAAPPAAPAAAPAAVQPAAPAAEAAAERPPASPSTRGGTRAPARRHIGELTLQFLGARGRMTNFYVPGTEGVRTMVGGSAALAFRRGVFSLGPEVALLRSNPGVLILGGAVRVDAPLGAGARAVPYLVFGAGDYIWHGGDPAYLAVSLGAGLRIGSGGGWLLEGRWAPTVQNTGYEQKPWVVTVGIGRRFGW